jgi:hypothetical protein
MYYEGCYKEKQYSNIKQTLKSVYVGFFSETWKYEEEIVSNRELWGYGEF